MHLLPLRLYADTDMVVTAFDDLPIIVSLTPPSILHTCFAHVCPLFAGYTPLLYLCGCHYHVTLRA